ncbi:MAG: hypothetical protein ACR2O4_10045, partial [Hyphomicrobiaceae bacterium]
MTADKRIRINRKNRGADHLSHIESTGVSAVGQGEWPDDFVGCQSVSVEFLRNHCILPLVVEPDGLHLAMADPSNEFAMKAMRLAAGQTIVPRQASADDILAAID